MGACDFTATAYGTSAQDAFDVAVGAARQEYGHRGYSGTIAEKQTFTLFEIDEPLYLRLVRARLKSCEATLKTMETKKETDWRFEPLTLTAATLRAESTTPTFQPETLANHYLNIGDPRIDDKWGPAGCLPYPQEKGKTNRKFFFFGTASE